MPSGSEGGGEGAAINQSCSNPVFKRLYPPTEGRLGNVPLLRRMSKVTSPAQNNKILKPPNVHILSFRIGKKTPDNPTASCDPMIALDTA
jgi:hypothetical protein